MTATTAQLKQRVVDAVDARRDRLIQLSDTLHAHPEIAFQEFKSAALLCDVLAAAGFAVERGIGGLETAFRAAAAGNGHGPTIALLAEYDALPDLGHACGHNIIGTAAVGAALAVQTVLKDLPGRVLVIGTPAEEGGGGKVILVEKGVFADVDAAMMVHPSSYTMVTRGSLASFRLDIEFNGRASHAAATPEEGINALEAVILTFNNINALRLHLKGDSRVHGIITHGGSAINIIPDYAAAAFSIRSPQQAYAAEIVERVIACAEGAARATGAHLKTKVTPGYASIMPNITMARRFADNWRSIGVEVRDPQPNERMGSTDMGNVSQVVPAIHPYIAIAPEGTPGHSVEIREASASQAGHQGLINAAKAMAMTTVELMNEPQLMEEVKKEFAASVKKANH